MCLCSRKSITNSSKTANLNTSVSTICKIEFNNFPYTSVLINGELLLNSIDNINILYQTLKQKGVTNLSLYYTPNVNNPTGLQGNFKGKIASFVYTSNNEVINVMTKINECK